MEDIWNHEPRLASNWILSKLSKLLTFWNLEEIQNIFQDLKFETSTNVLTTIVKKRIVAKKPWPNYPLSLLIDLFLFY